MNSDMVHELNEDYRSLARLVACSLDGIVMTDEQGVIVEWNPALEQLTGIPYSSAAGQYMWEILARLTPAADHSPEQAELEKAFIQELLASGMANGSDDYHERQIQTADQTILSVVVSVFTVPTDRGYRIANIIRDVTSARAAEKQLKTLLRAVEQSPTTVLITDGDGAIQYANPRLTELTGYTLDEVRGKTPRVFKSGHTPLALYQELWTTIKGGQRWCGQLLNQKKNGDLFWESIGISPVFDEQGAITQFVAIKEDISARKEAELRLRESETSLNRSQELALVGDWTWYTQTNTVRWSDEMYRIFGVDKASFTGDLNAVISAAIHPDDRASVIAANQAVLDEKQPNPLEYRVIWKDGSIHYIWAQPGDRVLDDQGNIIALSGIVQDITERKLADLRLRESERFARSTVDALSAELAILDELGNIITVNRAWREFARANAHNADALCEGINYLAVLAAVDPTNVEDKATANAFEVGLRSVMSGEQDEFSLEYPCHSPTEQRWFIGRVTRFGGDGPLRLVVAHENITERKLTELAIVEANQELDTLHRAVSRHNLHLEQTVHERTVQLRHLNDRLTTILNNVSDAIILVDADNQIETTNLAFDNLFGYDRDEVFGQPLRIIAAPGSQQELIKAKQAVRGTHDSQRIQIGAQCKNGRTFDADIALAYVKDNRDHIVCSIRDITFLKELDRAKDAFVSMVSHELRTPITAMVMGTETLSHYYDRLSDDKRLQKIAQVRQQAGVLSELVTAILDTTRFDSKKAAREAAPVDVRQTLRGVVAELTPQIEAGGHKLEVLTEAVDSMIILADHTDLARIWRNLIGNAIKYTGKGSTIKVHLYGCDPSVQSEPVSLPDLSMFKESIPADIQAGKYIIGMVEDNGPGICEQDLRKLFTRFFRGWAANTDIPGTGLGLSLVRDILMAYGGNITVHSLPDHGTTFCFWLPREY